MTINLQTGGYTPPPTLPGARRADIQVATKATTETVIPALQAAQAQPRATSVEEQRYERVLQAAQSYVANFYPVGSKKFAIYKDASGQLITRFVSLIDGKVTYVPEPGSLRASAPAPRVSGGGDSLVSIQA